ncbi:MAG TPA: PH domain-containing protein [Candidatus Moranbacteria bacterium]|nr:PH domain-containing protein [Candidatus Moranbacteria bacterium]HRZ33556.1 PH domain-containing protein [Candidatus Moranbacteria bacterium]
MLNIDSANKLNPKAIYLFALRSFIAWSLLMLVVVGLTIFVINIFNQKEIILSSSTKVGVGILNEYDYSKAFLLLIWLLPTIILSILSSLIWGFLVWKNYTFEITENSININYGIIKKTKDVIFYLDIEKIESEKLIAETLTGLVALTFYCSENKTSSFHKIVRNRIMQATYSSDFVDGRSIPGLSPEEALKLKETILSFIGNKINKN